MLEPIALKDFFLSFFAAASIILTGAAYALLFAGAKIHSSTALAIAGYIAYGLLLLAVFTLSMTAHFSDIWLLLSLLMMLGYFFAPRLIWHLCVKTHHTPHDNNNTRETNDE